MSYGFLVAVTDFVEEECALRMLRRFPCIFSEFAKTKEEAFYAK